MMPSKLVFNPRKKTRPPYHIILAFLVLFNVIYNMIYDIYNIVYHIILVFLVLCLGLSRLFSIDHILARNKQTCL